jgi:hypothetical protein
MFEVLGFFRVIWKENINYENATNMRFHHKLNIQQFGNGNLYKVHLIIHLYILHMDCHVLNDINDT